MKGPVVNKIANEKFNKNFLKSRLEQSNAEEIDQNIKSPTKKKNFILAKKFRSSIVLGEVFQNSKNLNKNFSENNKNYQKINNNSLYSQFLVMKAIQKFKSMSRMKIFEKLKEKHFTLLNENYNFDKGRNLKKKKYFQTELSKK